MLILGLDEKAAATVGTEDVWRSFFHESRHVNFDALGASSLQSFDDATAQG